MSRRVAYSSLLLALSAQSLFAGIVEIETRFKNEKRLLISANYKLKSGLALRSVRFDRDTLRTHELYLKKKDRSGSHLHVASDGTYSGAASGRATTGEILIGKDSSALHLNNRLVLTGLRSWDVFWVCAKAAKPKVTQTKYAKENVVDGFMRAGLTKESDWHSESGTWQLNKHGGGMATSQSQAKSAGFQRSVNPFSVLGADNGLLTYGADDWINGHFEARFYFGSPHLTRMIDYNHVPVDTEMLLVHGSKDSLQVAFGWDGPANAFVLKKRANANTEWEKLWAWTKSRPPITNWVLIGLTVRLDGTVEAWLDGKVIRRHSLGRRVTGPFHIGCGKAVVELDDVKAWRLPRPSEPDPPVFVQSRQFASKKEKGRADPEEFAKWAKSTNTFVNRQENIDERWFRATILTRMPLMGDFDYESLPFHKDAGELKPGLYEFQILRKDPDDPMSMSKLKLIKSLKFMRLEDGWMSNEFEDMDEENPQFTLRFRRRSSDQNRISVQIKDKFIPITKPVKGAVHFAIVRRLPRGNEAKFPKPWHHKLTCKNLVNEFFEEAPTGWNWVEGAFRMDSRWACQNQWNFMTCGGTGVPYLASKRRFYGDQEHEFFSSLRAVMPWEAGDTKFEYDSVADRHNGFRILRKNSGWYNRHDINFSFCTDGRNPLSGYAIIYGAHDNRENLLMRKGRIVARNKLNLFPREKGHRAVHWRWWNFRILRYGKHVKVLLNSQPLFDYVDDSPIDGGHIGIWTVRNGITVARVISMGNRVDRDPQFMYVRNDAPSIWQPLIRDSVQIEKMEGPRHSKITSTLGAGFHAVRYTLPTPVDLSQSPILRLPFKALEGCQAQIHVRIDRNTYIINTGAPLEEMKSLLTTEFEVGEQFQRKPWKVESLSKTRVLGKCSGDIEINLVEALAKLGITGHQLTEIAVGNTSNHNYLLAGNGANQAGSAYLVGTPTFSEK